MDGEEQSVIMN